MNDISSEVLTTIRTQRDSSRYKLFQGIVKIAASGTAVGIPLFGLISILVGGAPYWTLFGIFTMASISYLVALQIGTRSVDVGMYITILAIIFSVSGALLILGTHTPVIGAFMLAPFVAGLLSRHSIRDVFLTCLLTIILMFGLIVAEQGLKLYSPSIDLNDSYFFSIYLWASLIGIVGTVVMIFARNNNLAMTIVEQRTIEQASSLESLKKAGEVGNQIVTSLNSVTTELSASSTQQASGFQEQAAAINQVTNSLGELNESAGQIASNVEAVAASALQTVDSSSEMKNISELAENNSQEGVLAIKQAVESVERISNRIELLVQRLVELTRHSKNIDGVLALITDIASETHLLSLNASIEAAGNIYSEANGASNVRGERFGVIAQEVNSLAIRSQEATKQVRVTVNEMQGAVGAAVMAAEEGRKEIEVAKTHTYVAGMVIEKLNQDIANSANRAAQILDASEKVQNRCDEIKLSAVQQRTANEQILQTMQNILQVSKESASSFSQTTTVVRQVNEQVRKLNQVLDIGAPTHR